jgi:6-phosphogluconolactonase/glucosamine-6-phosphate isomerase/deaminase
MMANGVKKAPVIKRTVEGDVSNSFPASLIQRHQNAMLMIDADAASGLNKN